VRVCWLVVLVACGNDRVPFVAPPDTPIDVALPAGCDFLEQADSTNDFTLATGEIEQTGIALQQAFMLCGKVDAGHFDSAASTVDVDGFELEVLATARVLITFAGDPATLASLELQRMDTTNAVRDSGLVLGSHAAFETTLASGRHRFAVIARGTGDIAAAIDYQLAIAVDDPDARCAQSTATTMYVEADDGAQSDRNDMVEVRYAPNEKLLTAATNDAPEPSGIVTAAGSPVRITGTHADVDALDEFRDRDAYLIETGAHDQLAIRVDWTGEADLDYFLFPEGTTADIARGTAVGIAAPERATFPVLPNTRYWLWIGSHDSSAALPVTYDATLCPARAPI
jgi:hypothetical protein